MLFKKFEVRLWNILLIMVATSSSVLKDLLENPPLNAYDIDRDPLNFERSILDSWLCEEIFINQVSKYQNDGAILNSSKSAQLKSTANLLKERNTEDQ